MKYSIKQATDYLTQLTGCEARTIAHEIKEEGDLPLAIAMCYSFSDIEFMGTRITTAIPEEMDEATPMQLAKHQTRMMEVFRRPVVFVLNTVPSYQMHRLTQACVNFIVPGKLIFIPSLLMVLREPKINIRVKTEKMPPQAQMLVLYHLEKKRLDELNTLEISGLTGMAYPTVSVALRWLADKKIIALVGGKQKHVQVELSKRELWNRALPLMSSPIERTLFADVKPDGSLLAGESAMGHYTMLAEPTHPIVAINKECAKKNAEIMNKQYGDVRVEVWKYSPSLLSEDGCVDPLSLFLSMKDNEDERIQIECNALIEGMKW